MHNNQSSLDFQIGNHSFGVMPQPRSHLNPFATEKLTVLVIQFLRKNTSQTLPSQFATQASYLLTRNPPFSNRKLYQLGTYYPVAYFICTGCISFFDDCFYLLHKLVQNGYIYSLLRPCTLNQYYMYMYVLQGFSQVLMLLPFFSVTALQFFQFTLRPQDCVLCCISFLGAQTNPGNS